MNKAELLEVISTNVKEDKTLDVNKADAMAVAEIVLDTIKDTLKDVRTISIRNFGSFDVAHSKARKARNPRTGDTIDVPAKSRVKFKPAAVFNESVN